MRVDAWMMMILLMAALGGCGGSGQTGGKSVPRARVGQSVTVTGNDLDPPTKVRVAILRYTARAAPDDPGLANAHGIKKKGYRWARLRVRVANVGSSKVSECACSFKLVDSKDQRFEGEDISPGGVFEPPFEGGDIVPGDTVGGYVAVQVPRRTTPERAIYTSFGGGQAQWTLLSG
jgi:uncharacterized protein DUF4352